MTRVGAKKVLDRYSLSADAPRAYCSSKAGYADPDGGNEGRNVVYRDERSVWLSSRNRSAFRIQRSSTLRYLPRRQVVSSAMIVLAGCKTWNKNIGRHGIQPSVKAGPVSLFCSH